MTFDEFLERLATEPDRTTERTVRVPSADLLADVGRSGGMPLVAFLADPRAALERRTSTQGHRLGPGLSTAALADWQALWPRHPLPSDLRELLRRVNGVHLWADLETGRSYEGLAPLNEWDLARVTMYGAEADEGLVPDRYIALSYNADHSAFVVLNADTGVYYLMDTAGPDEGCPIGRTAGELLDWLWKHRLP